MFGWITTKKLSQVIFNAFCLQGTQNSKPNLYAHLYWYLCHTTSATHVPVILCMFIFSSSEGLCVFHLVRKK